MPSPREQHNKKTKKSAFRFKKGACNTGRIARVFRSVAVVDRVPPYWETKSLHEVMRIYTGGLYPGILMPQRLW
jgi:hypothetical protein